MPRKIPPDLQCKCPTCGADSNMFICQTCNELKPWHNGGTDGLECDECWKGDTMEHLAKLTERIPAKDALDIEIVVKRIVANAVSAALSPVNAELYKTQAALTDVRKQLKSEAQLGIDMAKDRDSWRADRDRILERYQTADKALHLICDITRVTALDKNYSLVVSSVKQLYDNLDASLQQALDLNKELDTAKAELLLDILTDLKEDEPVAIFCRFHPDLDTIHAIGQSLGRKVLELSGRINQLKEWQDGQAPLLAVQMQSGGVGVEMIRACYQVFYSLGYSLGDYLQARKRTDRPGQTRPVKFIHLVAENTKDAEVYRALENREEVVESILKTTRARAAADVHTSHPQQAAV